MLMPMCEFDYPEKGSALYGRATCCNVHIDNEFLYEARSSATTQQREIEACQSGEGHAKLVMLEFVSGLIPRDKLMGLKGFYFDLPGTFPNQPFQNLAQSLQFRISFDRASSYSPFSEHTFGVHKPHGAGFASQW
ncbi:hypothetical protein MKW98_023882 [Papaver atlanticum]|uniref:Uncharacterized protein n=1 Tax=Papaver atlanticum TaxID=357466 RepID=A0AAD4XNH7_9MAGN|nr:hypothetical protein MKW98_023882 [Papaver atlanticum]